MEKQWFKFNKGKTLWCFKDINEPISIPNQCATKVINVITLPELHLLLGSFNLIYANMLKQNPEIAMKWAKMNFVEREAMHGGTFNGNFCRKLLSKVDNLAFDMYN